MAISKENRRRGTTLLEFAFSASIVLFMILGVVQYGITYYFVSAVNNAAAEGARYASINPSNSDAIRTRVLKEVGGLDESKLTVTSTCYNDDNTVDSSCKITNRVTVTVSYPALTLIKGTGAGTIWRSSTCRIEKES